ncbi:hypothetical protein POM88_001287 [Heracleum sosnowskyi]|uniref:RRM domain-containing protein n=1 Tax=Heracleum sosnowskyi TaxID=360622 RepID=A0AAD8JFT4_9APIA|nr:hypothetical protein POM88_001287 [Heracleum sosnowskyi]
MEEGMMNFMKVQRELVDTNVMAMVLNGNKEAQRMALNQIHYNSLQRRTPYRKEREFEENKQGWQIVTTNNSRRIEALKKRVTIFVNQIPIETRTNEMWEFFTKAGKILDIILPRKKDKFNTRYVLRTMLFLDDN